MTIASKARLLFKVILAVAAVVFLSGYIERIQSSVNTIETAAQNIGN